MLKAYVQYYVRNQRVDFSMSFTNTVYNLLKDKYPFKSHGNNEIYFVDLTFKQKIETKNRYKMLHAQPSTLQSIL